MFTLTLLASDQSLRDFRLLQRLSTASTVSSASHPTPTDPPRRQLVQRDVHVGPVPVHRDEPQVAAEEPGVLDAGQHLVLLYLGSVSFLRDIYQS